MVAMAPGTVAVVQQVKRNGDKIQNILHATAWYCLLSICSFKVLKKKVFYVSHVKDDFLLQQIKSFFWFWYWFWNTEWLCGRDHRCPTSRKSATAATSWWWWTRTALWLVTRWWWLRTHMDWKLWLSSLRGKTLTTTLSMSRSTLLKSTSDHVTVNKKVKEV